VGACLTLDLQSSIVKVLHSDGKTIAGTGFLIHNQGFIVTCSHVIQPKVSQTRGDPRPKKVTVIFLATGEQREASVESDWWRGVDKEDIAILRIEGRLPNGVQQLPLGLSDGISGHSVKTYGFPNIRPEGMCGYGTIGDMVPEDDHFLLQLIGAAEISPGFSGGPILDEVTSLVVGMVTAITSPDMYGRMAETAFITPTETIRKIYPQLEPLDTPPYMDLKAFTENDAEFFFGREAMVNDLVEKLKASNPNFMLVMGPSGSGKSSVIQAGLIPRLRKCAVPGSDHWEFVVVSPADRPFDQLEAQGLDGASENLVESVRRCLKKQAGIERWLLVLDQFEEFLVTCPPLLRQQFWTCLDNLLDSDLPITLIVVMRDEFYSRFAQEAPTQIVKLTQLGFFQVSIRLETDDLRRIIELPARHVRLNFEEGLVQVIIDDVLESCHVDGDGQVGRSTILPLLEFALTQVWMRREQGFLTHQAYNNVGKVAGSLTAWADQVCRSMEREGLGQLTRRVFIDLINLGDETNRLPDSRRRRKLDDLSKDPSERDSIHRIVQRLADKRLVTTSIDKGQVTVEIIHDALIREWAQLQNWLKKDRSFLAWERELEKDARAWKETSPGDASQRDNGRLLRGLRLSEAERWSQERSSDLDDTELEFLQYSLDFRNDEIEREEKAKLERVKVLEKDRLQKRIIILSVFFSLLVVFAAYVLYQQRGELEDLSEENSALYLASLSELSGNNPTTFIESIKYAIESLRNRSTFQGNSALRRGLALLPHPIGLMKHNASVSTAVFSPNGMLIATASYDNTARIWNASSGKELIRMKHGSQVNIAVFSPDGTRIATASYDNTTRIWDVASGKELIRMKDDGHISAIAFSPDGTRIATASYDNTTRIWDVASGKELLRLNHGDPVNFISFSPDGTRIATACGNTSPLATNELDNSARIWDSSSGKELLSLNHSGPVNIVAFSPDGTRMATASYDRNNTVRIWDASSGKELTKLEHGGPVNSVVFSPDGTSIATASEDNTARIWDVASGKELARMVHHGLVNFVSFSPDGTCIITAGQDNTAIIWNNFSRKELIKLEQDGQVNTAIFSPDGTRIATASWDNTARIWNASSGKELVQVEQDGPINTVAFSPDGTRIATASWDNTACIWNASSGKELVKVEQDGPINTVAFSPDGTRIATASWDNTARIWNASSGKELVRVEHDSQVNIVIFSPDGTHIATDGQDNTIRIWDTSSGKELARMTNNDVKSTVYISSSPSSVAFSPNGSQLATTIGDNTIRIWDSSSGKELARIKHDGLVSTVVFSTDGTRIATASWDNTIRIWDASLYTELARLKYNDKLNSVVFSPDGTRIATTSGDHTAQIWYLDSEDLLCEACRHLGCNLTTEVWRVKYCQSCKEKR